MLVLPWTEVPIAVAVAQYAAVAVRLVFFSSLRAFSAEEDVMFVFRQYLIDEF